jgi:thiol-disulfide isomerase/thioredoxin
MKKNLLLCLAFVLATLTVFSAEDHFSADINTGNDAMFGGDSARMNEYITAFNAYFGGIAPQWSLEAIAPLSFKEYEAQLIEAEKKLKELLSKVEDENFVARRTRELETQLFGIRFRFAWAKRSIGERMDADQDFLAYVQTIDVNNMANARSRLTDQKIRWTMEIAEPDGIRDRYVKQVNTIANIVSDEQVRNHLLTEFVRSYLTMGGDGSAYQVFALYKKFCTDSASITALQGLYDRVASLARGTPAPDFKMYDAEEKEYRLSDLYGRVLYIDVWATWCGPCRLEKPHFERLAEIFKDDDRIKFISISVDERADAWKSMIEGSTYAQFIVSGGMRSDLCIAYGITGIPRFILIDEDGDIIDSNAIRPSDQNAEEILRSHLR